jgi:hypothetical protein
MSSVEQVRDAAIERARRGADTVWVGIARRAVLQIAHHHATFTTDEVWQALVGIAQPRESRALGAVMVALAHEKAIEPLDEYRKSTRRACHGRPVRVWRLRGKTQA